MGYGLEAFLMSSPQDVQIFGCKDTELLDEVLEAAAERLADYDDQLDVEGTERISHAQALREIFDGVLSRPGADDCD